jgi:hypothetical protein
MYYFRRKAYDSGMIYFKNVLAKYATSPKARDAALRLVESYKANRYREDASDLCAQLRQRYPKDSDVGKVCSGVPNAPPPAVRADSVKADSSAVPPIKPPPRVS